PGVDEHQRGIIMRHQRRRGDRGMALASEIIQEGASDFVGRGHFVHLGKSRRGWKMAALRSAAPRREEREWRACHEAVEGSEHHSGVALHNYGPSSVSLGSG